MFALNLVMVEAVPVRMDVVAMPVRVHVDQVRRLEQGRVREDLGRRRRRGDPVILGEHDATVGELAEGSEVVRGADDRFPARCSSTTRSRNQRCVRGSSAAVGSSNSRTSGFVTSTEAIATRFFSPPESW